MKSTVHYTDLGLVNTKEMFQRAMEGKYAIPAYNFNNMEQLQGIILGLRRNPGRRLSCRYPAAPANMPIRPC